MYREYKTKKSCIWREKNTLFEVKKRKKKRQFACQTSLLMSEYSVIAPIQLGKTSTHLLNCLAVFDYADIIKTKYYV